MAAHHRPRATSEESADGAAAWPGFEPTRRAMLAARMASGRVGPAAPGTPVTQPAGTPVTQPARTPATQPSGTPVTQPAGTPATQLSGTPVTQPAVTPATQPSGTPPTGTPTTQRSGRRRPGHRQPCHDLVDRRAGPGTPSSTGPECVRDLSRATQASRRRAPGLPLPHRARSAR